MDLTLTVVAGAAARRAPSADAAPHHSAAVAAPKPASNQTDAVRSSTNLTKLPSFAKEKPRHNQDAPKCLDPALLLFRA